MSLPPPLPRGTVDAHVHVFDPRFALAPTRDYTPGPATTQGLLQFAAALGTERFALVQPSVYGTDNSALLAALARLGSRARGVAVVAPDATADELAELRTAGVVGLRLNARAKPDAGGADLREPFAGQVRLAATAGLFVQVFTGLVSLRGIADLVAACPVPVVLDHFGGVTADVDGAILGADLVRELLTCPQVWVKLSAPYRVLGDRVPVAALAEVIAGYVEVAPDRLVWASDWPHTGGGADRKRRGIETVEPFRTVDVVGQLHALLRLLGPDQTRRTLVTNPQTLLGFPATAPPTRP